MRILVVLFFAIGFVINTFSQEIGEETKDGKVYKIHIVEAGNTLYGLHRQYEVSIDEIVNANPTVVEGLQIGQKLYIPFDKVADEHKKASQETTVHKVKRKETLYGISRMYECSVEDIIQLNPGVEDGLKTGRDLIIPVKKKEQTAEKKPDLTETTPIAEKEQEVEPAEEGKPIPEIVKDTLAEQNYKIEFTDSIIEYTVQRGETLYSISKRFMVTVEALVQDNEIKGNAISPGQVLIIKLKKERFTEVDPREISEVEGYESFERPDLIAEKSEYKVLVALPLRLSQNQNVLSGLYDDKTELNHLTELSVSFLMGAQMALDSLQKLGLVSNVEFFDTDGDLNKFKNYLGEKNEKNFDLIIGPLYPKLLEHAASWGKSNKVPVVAVTKIPTKLLEGNPFLISTVPSDLTLIQGMAKYLAQLEESSNIILLEGGSEAERLNATYFRTIFNEYKSEKVILKTGNLSGVSKTTLAGHVDPDKDNYFVCLSSNVQLIMSFVNALNEAKNTSANTRKANVMMVGLNEWNDKTALNSYYKNRFQFHFATSNHLNYDERKTVNFTKEFRTKYGSDPTRYAFHGFDVTLSQLAYLLLGIERNQGLMDNFHVAPIGPRHGYENASVFIVKQIDFEIQLLNIVKVKEKIKEEPSKKEGELEVELEVEKEE